jgi:hypothetical protein
MGWALGTSASAGCQKDGAEAFLEKVLRGGRACDEMVALELDPEVRDVPEFVFKKLQAEPVGNDPVAQHASGFGSGLEECHRVAAFGKLGCTTQTGRAGTHHGNRLDPRCGLAQGFESDLPGMLN